MAGAEEEQSQDGWKAAPVLSTIAIAWLEAAKNWLIITTAVLSFYFNSTCL